MLTLFLSQNEELDIDSGSVYRTVPEVIKKYKALSIADMVLFNIWKCDEARYLHEAFIRQILLLNFPSDDRVKSSKWVFANRKPLIKLKAPFVTPVLSRQPPFLCSLKLFTMNLSQSC